MYYLYQVNRREKAFPLRLLVNSFRSVRIFLHERPNLIITTGALAIIPMSLLMKMFGGKLIFIESFAKVTSPTETGKFLYRFTDRFYIQWEYLKTFYPKAIFLGGIY